MSEDERGRMRVRGRMRGRVRGRVRWAGARAMGELAVEARLARQEQDFAAIERGELLPSAFLDRHVWSPLRVRVAAMLGDHGAKGI